jgi:hypothetical protein
VRRIFTVPNPDGEGRVRASFAGFGEPETIDDPSVVGGKRRVDRIWVRYEEGELEAFAGLVRYSDIDPPL